MAPLSLLKLVIKKMAATGGPLIFHVSCPPPLTILDPILSTVVIPVQNGEVAGIRLLSKVLVGLTYEKLQYITQISSPDVHYQG